MAKDSIIFIDLNKRTPICVNSSYGVIYFAINKRNGKIYCGQTKRHLRKRIKEHRLDPELGRDKSYFGNAIRKYGFDSFSWYSIKICNNKKELDFFEKYYIEEMSLTNEKYGYNICKGGHDSKLNNNYLKKKSKKMQGALNFRYIHDIRDEEIIKLRTKDLMTLCDIVEYYKNKGIKVSRDTIKRRLKKNNISIGYKARTKKIKRKDINDCEIMHLLKRGYNFEDVSRHYKNRNIIVDPEVIRNRARKLNHEKF